MPFQGYSATLTFQPDGVRVNGIEQPLAEYHEGPRWIGTMPWDEATAKPGIKPPFTVVLKVPGHGYWSGRGQQSHAGVEFQVWSVKEPRPDYGKYPTFLAECITSFPMRRKADR